MLKPKEIWILRHAATEWSSNGRHTGCRSDIPLTEEGRSAAKKLSKVVAGVPFERVLVSPLDRTIETAQLAGLGAQMELEPDLREWDYGDFEGVTTEEIRRKYPDWTVWRGPMPGGESAQQVAERAARVIKKLSQCSGPVAIVSHGHYSRIFAATWLGLSPAVGAALRLDTGTYSVVGWEHEYPTILRWNVPVS